MRTCFRRQILGVNFSRRLRVIVVMPGQYPDRIKLLPLYDGQFDAYKLKAEGAEVLFASYPAGTEIPGHTHDTDNYGVITRGELIVTMRGETRRIPAGGWYHVPAHEQHSARFDIETDEIEFWFETESTPTPRGHDTE